MDCCFFGRWKKFCKSHDISKICSNLCLYGKKTKGIDFKRKLRLKTSWRYSNLQCQIFSKLFGLVKIRIKIQDSWVAWSIYAFWVVELWLKMRTLFGKKWNTLVVKILGDFILPLFYPLTNLVMNLPFSLYKSTCICLPTFISFGIGGQLFFFPFPLIFLLLLEMGEQFSFSLLISLSFGIGEFFLFPLPPFLLFLMSERFFSFYPPPTCSFRLGCRNIF